jgi:hypothetical protein
MNFQGEIPKGFIQTGKDAFRNQAYYDSVMTSMAKKSTQSNASKAESSFWPVSLLVLIATAIISLFFGSTAAPGGALPNAGTRKNT